MANTKQASLMGDIGKIASLYGAQGRSLLQSRAVKGAKKAVQPSRQNILQRLWQKARGLV